MSTKYIKKKHYYEHKVTLLRVIPTLAFQVIYSDIYFDILLYLAYLPAFYLVYILAFYLAYILAFYVAFFLAYILAFYVAFYVAYILAVFLAYILSFHLAAEVQRCLLSWEGPRLRSSGAHWARKVPGWGPVVPHALRTLSWGPAVPTQIGGRLLRSQQFPLRAEVGEERRVGKAEVDVEVEAEVVEERGGGRGGGGGQGGAGTAVIKSNNPHLAGGEIPLKHTVRNTFVHNYMIWK